MVHQNYLVASIKCNDKILREHSDTVYLPFGSTYSVLLKNLNTKKALVTIYIDGKTVIDGLILPPRSKHKDNTVEVERFLEDNYESGHKLKFIEKTDEISNYRGDNIEDGLIRIEYKFEQDFPRLIYTDWIYYNNSCTNNYWETRPTMYRNVSGNNVVYGSTTDSELLKSQSISCSTAQYTSQNDQGITVEGGYSDQSFQSGHIGPLEVETHVIVLNLKGYSPSDTPLKEPIGSRDKLQCKTCGRKWKSSHKFCGNCGTCLI